jgi:ubiquinone/menaquinone biosynthesis C-methylase UbiE
MELDEIRHVLEKENADVPWHRVYGGTISSLSDEKLKALFAPTLNYIQQKKHDFIVQQIKGCAIELPVLEVGAGTGSLARSLAKQSNKDFICLDVDEDALKCGEILAKAEGTKNVRFIASNFSDTRLDGRFSIIILDSVLEHIVEYQSWLDRIRDLLANGGICIVIVPSVFGGYSVLYDFHWKTLRWKSQPYNYHPGMHVNHFFFKDIVRYFELRDMKLSRVFKFQAFYAVLRLIMDKTRLSRLDSLCSVADYHLAKVLPADASTRVLIFRKERT